ncbi:hypothetical protein POTOM_003685 [Populus tomentosa]|uniref:Uncharacterized protein n=1 Tax=Populus tomentosa TaxID=118781 RepID=A0A8X8DD54_POPTO|nr:hypothetical protein POTOM_003685 [Populus tomentosa]
MPPLICTPPRYQLPLLTAMATQSYVLCILMLGLAASNIVASTTPSHEIHSFNRHSFPPGFIFGTASAAYQATQKGIIGITVASHWFLPYSNSTQDKAAAQRSLDFLYGWYVLRLFSLDVGDRDGVLIGPQAGSTWLHVYPKGIRKLLLYTKRKYNDPVIYITENVLLHEMYVVLGIEIIKKRALRQSVRYNKLGLLREVVVDEEIVNPIWSGNSRLWYVVPSEDLSGGLIRV